MALLVSMAELGPTEILCAMYLLMYCYIVVSMYALSRIARTRNSSALNANAGRYPGHFEALSWSTYRDTDLGKDSYDSSACSQVGR